MALHTYWLVVVASTIIAVTGLPNPQEDQDYRPCIPRDFGRGSVVCVCNGTYCDFTPVTLLRINDPFVQHADGHSRRGPPAQVWTSTKSGSRLHKSIIYFNQGEAPRPVIYESQHFLSSRDNNYLKAKNSRKRETSSANMTPSSFFENWFTDAVTSKSVPSVSVMNLLYYLGDFPRPNKLTKFTIRKDVKFQKILGVGGAFTDATGINIATLSKGAQENLIRSYFGRDGNDYSMGRTPIGGSDFSTRAYTLADSVDHLDGMDLNLTTFSLQPEDFKFKIPYIKWAQRVRNESLKLIASPWSAPAWMKTNNKLTGFGVLKSKYYQTWAEYFVRFLNAYQEEGIDIWGVTTGNEPLNGLIQLGSWTWPFNCLGWRARDMRKFIAEHLGPTLASLKPRLDVKIITLDDNKGAIPTWAKEVLSHKDAAKYVDGIGTHWYYDFLTGANVLSRFHQKYPDYFIVQTEACLGFTPWELEKVILGSWERGEQYLEAIIRDMKNFVGGWVDWNLVLDLEGGPNWANFRADAAILVNPSKDEFFKQPIYYAIGHVSKFVPPDSQRIDVQVKDAPRNLQYIAFLRPDKAIALIFLNRLNYDAKVSIFDEDKGTLQLNIPAQSFQTILY